MLSHIAFAVCSDFNIRFYGNEKLRSVKVLDKKVFSHLASCLTENKCPDK